MLDSLVIEVVYLGLTGPNRAPQYIGLAREDGRHNGSLRAFTPRMAHENIAGFRAENDLTLKGNTEYLLHLLRSASSLDAARVAEEVAEVLARRAKDES